MGYLTPCECDGRAEQPRFRTSDELDRRFSKLLFKSSFGDEPFSKTRRREIIAQSPADPSGNDDRGRSLNEREIARDSPKAHAKPVKRYGSQVVRTFESGFPERGFLSDRRIPALNRA